MKMKNHECIQSLFTLWRIYLFFLFFSFEFFFIYKYNIGKKKLCGPSSNEILDNHLTHLSPRLSLEPSQTIVEYDSLFEGNSSGEGTIQQSLQALQNGVGHVEITKKMRDLTLVAKLKGRTKVEICIRVSYWPP